MKSIDKDDYTAIYKKIHDVAPTLAGPSMSMIPNDIPVNYKPSMRNTFILANIYESPIKKVERFLCHQFS